MGYKNQKGVKVKFFLPLSPLASRPLPSALFLFFTFCLFNVALISQSLPLLPCEVHVRGSGYQQFFWIIQQPPFVSTSYRQAVRHTFCLWFIAFCLMPFFLPHR